MTIKIKETHKEYHLNKSEWRSFDEEDNKHYLRLVKARKPMIFKENEYIKHVLKKDGTLIIHSHDTN